MAVEWNICPEITSKLTARPDAAIARRAAAQHGVVTRAQLLELGLGYRAIDERIARGLLHPIHRGVFAVGHRLRTRHATWVAAVFAAGPDAALGFRAAAAFWRIRDSARIEVICPRKLRRSGIQAHRILLAEDEVMDEDGIRVTTPARTLFDLAAVVAEHQLEHAFNEAEYRRLESPTSVEALLARYPGRRGTANLRRVLDTHRRYGETVSREELERRFLAFLDAHGLPRPKVNRLTEHGELDATWPEDRLVVELDGFAAHGTRKAFEADRARDRALVTAGWRVIRITWRQLTAEQDMIAAQLQSSSQHTRNTRRTRGQHRAE